MPHRFFALFLVCGVGMGCGDNPHAASTFVGEVEGTDVRVGLVTEGGSVAMFFCGGATSYTQSTKWFRGAAEPRSIAFAANSWVAKGSADGDTASGIVDRGNGIPLRWTAHKVSEDGLPGLYELKDDHGTAGVIVLDADHAQGALVSKTMAVQQIEAIRPVRNGNGVQVNVVEATPRAIVVTRVRAR
jgi:hypothetical protein